MRLMRVCLVAGACVFALGVVHASSVIGLTVEDQARLSRHVVVGEVVSQRGVDDPLNGLETEVTLKVVSALKGGARPGQTLAFHTRSGELNGEISTAVGETVLRTGQRVLVFVEEIDGRLYNLGLSYGVFQVHENGKGRLSVVRDLQDGLDIVGDEEVGNGPFPIEDIRTRVAYAQRHPKFDSPIVRDNLGEGR